MWEKCMHMSHDRCKVASVRVEKRCRGVGYDHAVRYTVILVTCSFDTCIKIHTHAAGSIRSRLA